MAVSYPPTTERIGLVTRLRYSNCVKDTARSSIGLTALSSRPFIAITFPFPSSLTSAQMRI